MCVNTVRWTILGKRGTGLVESKGIMIYEARKYNFTRARLILSTCLRAWIVSVDDKNVLNILKSNSDYTTQYINNVVS